MTDKPTTIYEAFAKFQEEMKSLELSKEVKVTTKSGGSYKFKYTPLPAIIEAIKPILAKNGLSFVQSIQNGDIITEIMHISEKSFISRIPFITPDNLTPQEMGSRITYMRRYGLTTALGLVSEEDDDANIASGNQFKSPQMVSVHEEVKKWHQPSKSIANPTINANGEYVCPKCGKVAAYRSGASAKGSWEGVQCSCTKGIQFINKPKSKVVNKVEGELDFVEEVPLPMPPEY